MVQNRLPEIGLDHLSAALATVALIRQAGLHFLKLMLA
jgi:hypothetical protein